MAFTVPGDIEAFKAAFSGQALTPGHPDYDRRARSGTAPSTANPR